MEKYKKILLPVLLVAGFGIFLIYQILNGIQNNPLPPPSRPQSGYKDGQYTGDVADAFYGTVQVRAIISGGNITDVQFLQNPHNSGTSQDISGWATPRLKQEAIKSQSAKVDIVSGATQTSQAFIQSLSSALYKAM